MKLKELSKEELDTMSYDQIAYLVLEEYGRKMKLLDIFKKVAKYLKLSDVQFENQIADFFELISTDKKFVMLEKGYWDLSNKHMKKVIIEDEDETIIDDSDNDIIDDEDEKGIFYTKEDEDSDDEDDDLSDLVIIDSEEETSL